jgi:hypothetical protein
MTYDAREKEGALRERPPSRIVPAGPRFRPGGRLMEENSTGEVVGFIDADEPEKTGKVLSSCAPSSAATPSTTPSVELDVAVRGDGPSNGLIRIWFPASLCAL